MSRHVSPSANRSYGVQRATRVWATSPATLYRHRHPCHEPHPRRRPGPVGPMPDATLVEAIRAVLAASPFHGEGHRKVWARLRFAGIRASKRRVLRLMREHGLLAPGRVGRPHGSRAHDGTIRTERVDAMWGTDLTSTMIGEGQASIVHGRSLLDGMPWHPRRVLAAPPSAASTPPRWHERADLPPLAGPIEDEGAARLLDRRLRKSSAKRRPAEQLHHVPTLYRERYGGFTDKLIRGSRARPAHLRRRSCAPAAGR